MGLISSLVEKAVKIQISTKKWAGGNPQTAASRTSQETLKDGNGEWRAGSGWGAGQTLDPA